MIEVKKFLTLTLILVTLIFYGCGSKKIETPLPEKNERPKISSEEAETKILEWEKELDVQYDSMRKVTYYSCPIYLGRKVCVAPYVSVADEDYSVNLFCHVVYSGREQIDFDKLYIRIGGDVSKFYFNDISRMYHAGYYGDEYNGEMPADLYYTLKQVIDYGAARIRLEGNGYEERNLLPEEIEHMEKVFAIYELLSTVDVEE